ncbi:hypothetical protein KRR26_22135 [Corallococcus sp. M34]|uniref:hypothetical protein n=1 Tax=Citreicoccus inhibens TaxID=2849499 RepID=UPI001C2348C0|nr:hypothetical protein [Citreicoccus inhibens]MBU8898314.1 hypothetical protein [Citreicoccus inhibens]
MPRRLLIILLAAGTVGGYASGFASLAHRHRACHAGAAWDGPSPRTPQPAPTTSAPPPAAASSGPVIVSVTPPPAFAPLPVAATAMPTLMPSPQGLQALYVATPMGLQPVIVTTAAGAQPVYVAAAPMAAGVTGFALSTGNLATLDASPAVRPSPTLALPVSMGSAPAATTGAR